MRHFSKPSDTKKYRISAPVMVNDRVYPHWQRDSDSWTQSTKCNSTELATYDSTNVLVPHAPATQHETAKSAPETPRRPDASYTSRRSSVSTVFSFTESMEQDLEAKAAAMAAPETFKPHKKEWLIMISLAFISFMVSLDATILVTVLPEIAHQLNGTSAEAFWAGTSYLLTSAVFQPVIASISQTFGRQQMLIVSLVFFTAGTAVCAFSNNFTEMLTGRCIQGVGGGGIITLTQVIFCDIVPLRQRPKYFAMVLGAWAIGSILGPVLGGLLTEHKSWRFCFHINYPFCGIGFVVAIFFVRLNAVSKLTFTQKLKQTDWLGAFLFVGSMTSFLVGLSWGGIQHPWNSVATLGPIIAGVVGVALFVGWQYYMRPHSLLPMSIFYNWSAAAAFYSALSNGLILFTAVYYLPFYLMSVHHKSSTDAGIDLFPALCLMIPGSIVVAGLTTRLGRFRWAIWAGWAITTTACGLMLLFDLHTKTVVFATVLAVFGIGCGMILTSVNVGIQAISRPEDCAMAASMYGFFRSLGMPLGVAVAGTVFQNAMSGRLAEHGLPASIAHDSERWVFILRTMAESEKKTAILESYMKGFESVFYLMTAIAASAMLTSFAIKKFSMDKILLTKFTAR